MNEKIKNIVIVVLSILIIAIGALCVYLFSQKNSEALASSAPDTSIDSFAKYVEINKDIKVYSSADKKVLFVELRDYSSDNSEQLENVFDGIRKYSSDLSNFEKLITIAYMKDSPQGTLLLRHETDISDLENIETLTNEYYIDFDSFNDLFDDYTNAMKYISN